MKLLLDANLSPRIVEPLRAAGYDAEHVADLGLVTATDGEIFDRAAEQGLVVVTADSDFGALLAMRRSTSPSVRGGRCAALAELHDAEPVHPRDPATDQVAAAYLGRTFNRTS